ncbi:MAG: hypothetical protein OEM91_17030, partial [Hyphomicrobiales bacterium]|nr:hypothetical protein [Hyphomicrobiales bacterium]
MPVATVPLLLNKAGRRFGLATISLYLAACLSVPGPAGAFELFGIHLFGERKSQEVEREPVP